MTDPTQKRCVIIGAGPAGLTAALELVRRTDMLPVVLEASQEIGGISRTVRYKGNRMDIGGHRFFSKSERVMQWWMDLMPVGPEGPTCAVPAHMAQEPPLRGMGPLSTNGAAGPEGNGLPHKDPVHLAVRLLASAPENSDLVMLVRPRRSRIYYLRKFFDYPIRISGNTIRNLGAIRIARIGASYLRSRMRPIARERSLEDFLVNRFGRELYRTFFKSYTEKVWGIPCNDISPEWGAQRIRGLSLGSSLKHLLKHLGTPSGNAGKQDIAQRKTDTSLIERFLYPKFGPGQFWEHVAGKVTTAGGELHMNWKVDRFRVEGDRILAVEAVNGNGERRSWNGTYFLSTMPMRELIQALEAGGAIIPAGVREVSEGLQYRDFITVGVLANRLEVKDPRGGLIQDTWIYIQEPDVLLGRLQIFNNWSPHMVSDPDKVWIGLEYFCHETDPLWAMPDEELKQFAVEELQKIGILQASEVLDAHVVRAPKAYPAYFGTYNRFEELRAWVDRFENLFLIGRNGMHKYNNQDHSMLTAMTVIDGIVAGRVDKQALWSINTEQESHEEKTT